MAEERMAAKARRAGQALGALLALTAVAGCGNGQAKVGPPEVFVEGPVAKEVTDFVAFTGRTEASASVEVRSLVSGYLRKAHFADGAIVERGDVLFETEGRGRRAEVARAEADLQQAEARFQRLNRDSWRARKLWPTAAMSKEEADKVLGEQDETGAEVAEARAALDLARLNLGHTRICAPIGGQIGRRSIDPGNLIKADETVLATIVSLGPIRACFDLDERTLLKLWRAGPTCEGRTVVQLGLADEQGFSLTGALDFLDNRVDPRTGTLRVRVVVESSQHLLSPGMFVRARFPVGPPHRALLVPQQAVGTDQGESFAYVLDDEDEVTYRHVTVGPVFDGWQVVKTGLAPQDRVVVGELQRVRPGTKVVPRRRGKENGPAR